MYEGIILSSYRQALPPLIDSLKEPFYMDIKLAMIQKFLPKIQFIFVDMLIVRLTALVDQAQSTNGIMVCNINPFMVASAILQISEKIKRAFPLARLRIEQYEATLQNTMITLLEQVYDPYKISKLLKQRDISGTSCLDYFGKLKLYGILKTKTVDRVVKDYWTSKVDISGSVLENSTSYNILKFAKTKYREDFEEKKYRFYHKRNLGSDVRPHQFAFRVWFQSMSLRYNIEMLFFAICVLVFQYFISSFNTDMHQLDKDIEHLKYYHIIEILPTGHIITLQEIQERNRQRRGRNLSEALEAKDHGTCLYSLKLQEQVDPDANDETDDDLEGEQSEQLNCKQRYLAAVGEEASNEESRSRLLEASGGGRGFDPGQTNEQQSEQEDDEEESDQFNYCFCLGIFTEEQQLDIKNTKAHLDYEIRKAVLELDEAMVIAMVSFALPFQLIISYVYARLTGRTYVLRATSLLDMGFFALVSVWFYRYEVYIHSENRGFGLTNPPHEYHIFMQQLLEDNRTGDFHFDWLLSAVAFFIWLRLLFMLILTNTFGPLITITIRMMKDLTIFFVLFIIELVAFSCVAILSFGNLPEYQTLPGTMVLFFESALGNWDFSIYDVDKIGSESKYWYGIIFHIFVLLVNMLLLLNLVIAIMSDTYAFYSRVMLGLFSQGIIEAIPSYQNDKRYGALISAFPPFNLITMLALPIMLCIKDKKKLESFNTAVCKVVYLPVVLCMALYFTSVSMLLIPFAYLKTVLHKYKLYKRAGKVPFYRNSLIFYIFLGIPMLLISQITDLYWFFRHSYRWQMQRVQEANAYPKISLAAFNKFQNMVQVLDGNTYSAKKLVLAVNQKFKVHQCLFGVLYTNKQSLVELAEDSDAKPDPLQRTYTMSHGFYNEPKRMITLSLRQTESLNQGIEYNLRGLNTYNLIKRVIWSSVTDSSSSSKGSGLINLPLLKGLLTRTFSVSNLLKIYT